MAARAASRASFRSALHADGGDAGAGRIEEAVGAAGGVGDPYRPVAGDPETDGLEELPGAILFSTSSPSCMQAPARGATARGVGETLER
jgi:hypothetical protein